MQKFQRTVLKSFLDVDSPSTDDKFMHQGEKEKNGSLPTVLSKAMCRSLALQLAPRYKPHKVSPAIVRGYGSAMVSVP